VLDLSARGLVVAAIADTLNISDRRVKTLLAANLTNGSDRGSNGSKPHDFPLNQAVLDPVNSHLPGVGQGPAIPNLRGAR
jgi:hypothetical protein